MMSPCNPYPPQMCPGVRKIGRRNFFSNSYEIRKWVSVLHFGPCYTPHKRPGRTWRPDFPFKLSNVMPDFQFYKNLWRRFHERAPQRGQLHRHSSTHSTRTSSGAFVPYRPAEIAPKARLFLFLRPKCKKVIYMFGVNFGASQK